MFTPGRLRRGVRGSSALEDEPDDGVGKELDDSGARAQGAGVISAGTDDLGLSVCFLRIHVALRVALETKRRFETPIWDSDCSKKDGRPSSSSGTRRSRRAMRRVTLAVPRACEILGARALAIEVIGSPCGPCARTCAALPNSAKRCDEPLRNTCGTAPLFRLAAVKRHGSADEITIRNTTGTMQLIA